MAGLSNALAVAAVGFALVSGSILGSALWLRQSMEKRKSSMRRAMGVTSLVDALHIDLESGGLSKRMLSWAIQASRPDLERSLKDSKKPSALTKLFSVGWQGSKELVELAGLGEFITQEGFVRTRARASLAGCLVGALVGCVFSLVLMTLGLCAGFMWGWHALPKALKDEVRERSFVAEKQLSQMIEIVILGLKSGMTFDRALVLFCQNFKGSLSSSLGLAHGQWSHGLVERSEGLRALARSYDSPLFDRFAENVIRSLRFGTSLAGNLSVLSAEARAVRKAKLEEKVAKAPIKMLLPVGTLILPAMLVLIMGPIMLDLMQGF